MYVSRIEVAPDARVLVMTGAGVSKESGIPTFRDAGGLWEGVRVEDVASPEGFRRDPRQVWKLYAQRRAGLLGASPNAGHHALVALEEALGDRFLLVTQNVDGLHARAGSRRLVELHGNLLFSRCATCDRPPFEDHEAYEEGTVPFCGRCAERGGTGVLRPHVVWFGESLRADHLERIERFVLEAGPRLIYVAIGTSGLVYPAAAIVDGVRRAGGRSWLVNAEPAANTARFDHFVQAKSAEVLPSLFALGSLLAPSR